MCVGVEHLAIELATVPKEGLGAGIGSRRRAVTTAIKLATLRAIAPRRLD